MKKAFLAVTISAAFFLLVPFLLSDVHAITYSEVFTKDATFCPGSPQYDNWKSFKQSLTGTNYTKVTISGSEDTTGRSCTDPAVVNQMAAALHTRTAGSWSCDGRTWYVDHCYNINNFCGGQDLSTDNDFGISAGDVLCSCNYAYAVRAGVASPDWGAVDTYTCDPDSQTLTVTFYEDDNDSIDASIEDAGPNGGDGNGDGIKDSEQSNVTSLPSATDPSKYITLVVTGQSVESSLAKGLRPSGVNGITCQNSNIQVYNEASQGDDLSFSYPYGLIGFQVADCYTQGGSVLVTIFFHGAQTLEGFTYRRYGPTPPDFGSPSWYTMPGAAFGTANVGGVTVPTASFIITDGQLGDDTKLDGVIMDQGGPGNVAIPAMNEWGMIIFIAVAGLGALYYLRRKRRVNS